MVQASFEE